MLGCVTRCEGRYADSAQPSYPKILVSENQLNRFEISVRYVKPSNCNMFKGRNRAYMYKRVIQVSKSTEILFSLRSEV